MKKENEELKQALDAVIERLKDVDTDDNFSVMVSVSDSKAIGGYDFVHVGNDRETFSWNVHSLLKFMTSNPVLREEFITHTLYEMSQGNFEKLEDILQEIRKETPKDQKDRFDIN